MLYTLLHSPWQCDFDSLLSLLQEEDDLLLLQDGVIAGVKNSKTLLKINIILGKVWVLEEDVAARGLYDCISNRIMFLDYYGFVNLTKKHKQQIAW